MQQKIAILLSLLMFFTVSSHETPLYGGKNMVSMHLLALDFGSTTHDNDLGCCSDPDGNADNNHHCDMTVCCAISCCFTSFSKELITTTNRGSIDSYTKLLYLEQLGLSTGFNSIWTPPKINLAA